MGDNLPTNKVFHSPYKADIEQRLAMGQSPRSISKWLALRGEDISYATILKYKKEFFNVDAEATKIIEDGQKQMEDTIENSGSLEIAAENQKKLMETEMHRHLGAVRSVNHVTVLYENIQDMREYLMKLRSYDPIVASHAAKGLYSEMRATIETLEKIREKEGVDDDSSVAKMLSSLKKQKRELEENAKQRQREEEGGA